MVVRRCSAAPLASCSTYTSTAQHCRAFAFRSFSSSAARLATHYDTLSIPNNATKSQIKSSFYKLSKKYHPDVNKDPGAKDRFSALSEAYSILVDDRQRRAYDRTLAAGSSAGAYHPAAAHHEAYHPGYWSYETRHRPGATHAWEHPRRRYAESHHPQAHPHPHAYQARQPHASPSMSSRTAGTPPRTGWQRTETDKAHHVSSFWRTTQVLGLIVLITALSGGWRSGPL